METVQPSKEDSINEIAQEEQTEEKVTPTKVSPTKSPTGTTPKRVKGTIVDDECKVEVPEGWRRQVVQRQGGLSAGKFDVYYFSPLGKKLRSRKEVQTHCEENNLPFDTEIFKFTRISASGPPKRAPRSLPTTPKMPKSPKIPKLGKNKKLNASKDSSGDATSKKPSPRVVKNPSPFKVSSDGLAKRRKKSVWVPPKSPFNLFQENLFQNPWKLLVGTLIMNRSPGEETLTHSFLPEFFKKWPSADVAMKAESREVAEFLKPISNNTKIAKIIIKFSEEYLNKKWAYPKELHGIGRYGNDSYRIFCLNEWKKVKPTDFLLNFYVHWLWDNHTVLGLD